jgi:hypothetical protein
MSNEFSKIHAKKCLSGEGFIVEEISTAQNSRADLRASWNNEEYIIEAKGKDQTLSWTSLVSKAESDVLSSISRDVKPWNALSAVTSDAYKQLTSTPASNTAFRILWLVAAHNDSAFVLSCIEKRLFGLENVVAIKSFHTPPIVKPCYYHGHNDFIRFPDLDAVILSNLQAGYMCVNSFSHRRQSLRASRLYSVLNERGAVRDPEIAESEGTAFLIAEKNINRSSSGGQWKYLKEKYGYGTSVMMDSQFNALMSVDLSLETPVD